MKPDNHKTVSFIEVPEKILKACHPSVRNRRMIEYRIVHRVVTDLLAAGFKLTIDHGGESMPIAIQDATIETMAEMFACDDEYLFVREKSKDGLHGWVRLIYGNDGWDVISDHSGNLESHLAGANKFADSFGGA